LFLFFLGVLMLDSRQSFAQSEKIQDIESPQQAIATEQGAYVYQSADFDAPIIGQLRRGQIYDISRKAIGPFYQIKLRPGVIGFVSDVDVKPGVSNQASSQVSAPPSQVPKAKKIVKKEEPKKPKKPRKPFVLRRYRGPVIEQINFTESTMGAIRSQSLTFYGFKWSGFNTLFSGETFTDAEILVSPKIPGYYRSVTGQNASGMIVKANFLFETPSMQGRHHMIFYGFGPMFRYSQFNAAVRDLNTDRNSNYAMDDMVLGALFNLGLAYEIGRYALRSDVRYHIESRQYFGFGLSLQFEF
jgi:hypothetical protein